MLVNKVKNRRAACVAISTRGVFVQRWGNAAARICLTVPQRGEDLSVRRFEGGNGGETLVDSGVVSSGRWGSGLKWGEFSRFSISAFFRFSISMRRFGEKRGAVKAKMVRAEVRGVGVDEDDKIELMF